MNRLTSMCYPEYFEDKFEAPATPPLAAEAKQVNFGNRMKPPLTKLRIGELYGNSKSELLGYIKTLSYSVDQTSPFETESENRVPKFIIATISYQVIHSEVPNLKTKFYGYVGD